MLKKTFSSLLQAFMAHQNNILGSFLKKVLPGESKTFQLSLFYALIPFLYITNNEEIAGTIFSFVVLWKKRFSAGTFVSFNPII